MAINGTNIVKPQLFKNSRWGYHTLHVLFGATHKFFGMGEGAQCFFTALAQLIIKLTGP